MALVTCSDCGKQVSDAAAACPQCGRPIRAVSVQADSPVTIEATSKQFKGLMALGATLPPMNLRDYLKLLSTAQQERFARDCGTSIGYLRKVLSSGCNVGAVLALRIEHESGGAVCAVELSKGLAEALGKAGYSKREAA